MIGKQGIKRDEIKDGEGGKKDEQRRDREEEWENGRKEREKGRT